MNLSKLFEMQKALDERIIREKGLEGKNLLPMKILALQVELGELANEFRGFKFWSNDQEPRTVRAVPVERGGHHGIGTTNPLLEEYVDCLHFILSIGLQRCINIQEYISANVVFDEPTEQFNAIFNKVGDYWDIQTTMNYWGFFGLFLGLGEMLGLTWEDIEQAYVEKNRMNHQRQDTGY